MGRGLPNSPSAQTQQPFSCSFSHRPWSSLRKAFARNSVWIKIVSGTEKCLYVVRYDVVILGSFSHTRLDRGSRFPIVVGNDIGVAILDILFGYADVVIGNVHFPSFSQSQFLSL